ncbi:MAG: hypothetical protein ACUVXA_19265 [Candidatus Jordarchaeum sp.]|uniref:hypothetical protein n=1 Tax=Candidatus Jordarchaeum sp. TaxID=2823881 RepID=UPI004049A196
MSLPEKDVELFYKLYHPLLVYVNVKENIVESINSPEDIKELPDKRELGKIRTHLYNHLELIGSFVAENPLNFSSTELNIISGWKNFVKGEFLVFRYMKKYTVFLKTDGPPKAYGVLSLYTPFEEMLGSSLPVMVDCVLLPFKDKIVYDGIVIPYNIFFGGGIRRSFNHAYQEAKHRFGIITSLPFIEKEEKQSDADKLKFYLKSESNRERYWEEIDELIKDPNLLTLYHQEMGKIHAKTLGKRLREVGLTQGWFATLEGEIVASGTTREEVERIANDIVPAEKRNFVYIFQLKTKQ